MARADRGWDRASLGAHRWATAREILVVFAGLAGIAGVGVASTDWERGVEVVGGILLLILLVLAAQRMLTTREQEVLVLASQGLTSKQIGGRLCIAEGTVRYHLKCASTKLHATNRPDLIRRAYEAGVLRRD